MVLKMAGCLGRIQEACSFMTPRERQAAEYVLANPAQAAAMSVEELSAASGSSTASVLRMCRKVGLGGYRDFVRLLSSDVALRERGEVSFGEIHPGDSLEAIAGNVIRNSTYALENTLSILDQEELRRAVTLLCKARRIDFYGVGASGNVAQDAYSKFLRIGALCTTSANPHTQILTAMSLTPQDAAILISYSGETLDMLSLQQVIRQRGTPTISITQYGSNALATASDIRLFTTASEPLVRSGPMTSRLSQMVMLDILYIAVCTEKFDQIKGALDESQHLMQKKHTK